jgi:hypothetical protein
VHLPKDKFQHFDGRSPSQAKYIRKNDSRALDTDMQQAYVEYTQSEAAAMQELEVMNRQYYAVSLTRKDHTMPAKRGISWNGQE